MTDTAPSETPLTVDKAQDEVPHHEGEKFPPSKVAHVMESLENAAGREAEVDPLPPSIIEPADVKTVAVQRVLILANPKSGAELGT